jgi:squalene-hopene/tetraprenyl-beta-curcumene cyclase
MALDALVKAGVEPGDPTLRKALEFLQRCQNRSESNDVVLAEEGATVKSGDDGGAGYAPGVSKAGMMTLADGTQVPRSYGSMTYALLKGYLLAGLPKDDPRVEAAWRWLTKNYTLDVNPGFEASSDPAASYQGLFYYFHTMARALDLYGTEVVEDAGGTKHAWRSELVGRLATMQRQDGSWVNENAERWYEGNPVLATAYAMMALDEATPDGAFPTPTAPAAGSDGK